MRRLKSRLPRISTEGPSRAMGERGAKAADTLGEKA